MQVDSNHVIKILQVKKTVINLVYSYGLCGSYPFVKQWRGGSRIPEGGGGADFFDDWGWLWYETRHENGEKSK